MFFFCSMAVETMGQALSLGWRLTARCAHGPRDGIKRIRECIYSSQLDLETIVWTRGSNFPIALLASRLKCPRCHSDRVSIIFHTPSNENLNRLAAE
jgi:hypothetical protein